MSKTAGLFITLLIASVAFADIIQSGDGGTAFATGMSVEKCKEPNVSAVFICSGNVVKVISINFDEGIVFYKPDGKVVYCPEAAPADMGAECVQLLGPNLCSPNSVCPPANGSNVVEQPFVPSVNQTPQQPSGNQGTEPSPANNTEAEQSKEEQKKGIGEDIYVYGIIVIGMVIIAFLNYVYFKTRGTGTS